MILRNAVWCDILQNMGWNTTLCCILNTWISFISLFLAEHTRYQILLQCTSQCLLSCGKSFYLAHGWSLSSLSLNQNYKWGRVLIGVGWLCLLRPTQKPCKPADYRYRRLTVCIIIPLCEVCVTNVMCVTVSVTTTLSRNVLVFRWMCVRVWF